MVLLELSYATIISYVLESEWHHEVPTTLELLQRRLRSYVGFTSEARLS